jgi:hypothetical protein
MKRQSPDDQQQQNNNKKRRRLKAKGGGAAAAADFLLKLTGAGDRRRIPTKNLVAEEVHPQRAMTVGAFVDAHAFNITTGVVVGQFLGNAADTLALMLTHPQFYLCLRFQDGLWANLLPESLARHYTGNGQRRPKKVPPRPFDLWRAPSGERGLLGWCGNCCEELVEHKFFDDVCKDCQLARNRGTCQGMSTFLRERGFRTRTRAKWVAPHLERSFQVYVHGGGERQEEDDPIVWALPATEFSQELQRIDQDQRDHMVAHLNAKLEVDLSETLPSGTMIPQVRRNLRKLWKFPDCRATALVRAGDALPLLRRKEEGGGGGTFGLWPRFLVAVLVADSDRDVAALAAKLTPRISVVAHNGQDEETIIQAIREERSGAVKKVLRKHLPELMAAACPWVSKEDDPEQFSLMEKRTVDNYTSAPVDARSERKIRGIWNAYKQGPRKQELARELGGAIELEQGRVLAARAFDTLRETGEEIPGVCAPDVARRRFQGIFGDWKDPSTVGTAFALAGRFNSGIYTSIE